MKNLFSKIILSSFLFTFFSCEKEATNIELPHVDPKLVVYGYLSPDDSLIEISLSKSVPYFGNNTGNIYKSVVDATVILSSEGRSIQLPFSFESETYKTNNDINFPILAGKTYTLQVNSPGGFSVSAETTVPQSAPIQASVQIDSTIKNNRGFTEKIYRITTRFNDIRGRRNFYESSTGIYQNGLRDPSTAFFICNRYLSDENEDGKEYAFTCEYSNYFDDNNSIQGIKGRASINMTDVAYYKYHVSLANYTDENPFSEPSRIFSNIEGGLGCFGSYVNTTVEF